MDAIHKQFLNVKFIKELHWGNIIVEDLDENEQKLLLSWTLLHPTCVKYPPLLTLRKSFLKHVINKLEKEGKDVCDEMYELYTSLLTEQPSEFCYKTYFLVEDQHVTLRESTNMISSGTTGLITWQAAQKLAEFALDNIELFKDKHVLELGSGLGFTGLAVLAGCQPASFIFSDFHHQVLDILRHNVSLNFQENNLVKQTRCTTFTNVENNQTFNHKDFDWKEEKYLCDLTKWRLLRTSGQRDAASLETAIKRNDINCEYCEKGNLKESMNCYDREICKCRYSDEVNTNFSIMQLDWDNMSKDSLLKLGDEVDIVIAADVVYDDTIIPALVQVIHGLLQSHRPPSIFMASTVRNEETVSTFLKALYEMGIAANDMKEHITVRLNYDRSIPILLHNLSLK